MSSRSPLDPARLARAREIVTLAWQDLPRDHQTLLEAIGARQFAVVDAPLGRAVSEHLRSAGLGVLQAKAEGDLNEALGVWIEALRIVLIDAGHPKHAGTDDSSFEAFMARIAWHEWGHALSVTRASGDDVRAGSTLLATAPPEIAGIIRGAGYRPREYTNELVAEIYALLMARRRRGQTGKPAWLDQGLYDLVRRLTGWTK